MVDPLKDMTAELLAVRSGFKTMPQALAEMGFDAEVQLAEIAKFNTLVDDLGVILDTDARRMARGGTPVDARQNAAVQLAARPGDQGPPPADDEPDPTAPDPDPAEE
jgi:capsid protein